MESLSDPPDGATGNRIQSVWKREIVALDRRRAGRGARGEVQGGEDGPDGSSSMAIKSRMRAASRIPGDRSIEPVDHER